MNMIMIVVVYIQNRSLVEDMFGVRCSVQKVLGVRAISYSPNSVVTLGVLTVGVKSRGG